MARIKKLSPIEAQKIAAGEVVERPAHVVKELIENALDAGATEIAIHLEDGGRKCIQVTDNGYGMSEEDARLCIEPYATSKLVSVDDLATLHTFGFRGEALSSIASVSKCELTTKETTAATATFVQVSGGILEVIRPSAGPTGTQIAVRDLFYNIPARRKFLRKRETELHQIQHIVHGFCFTHLSTHFKLFSDGQLLLNCPPTDSLLSRIAHVWGSTTASHMVSVTAQQKHGGRDCAIAGAISDWQLQRYDRSHQFLFINERLVKNYQLTTAINKVYQKVLPAGRYPAVCLALSIDPEIIDVNVHPRKEEVQFLHPQLVVIAIERAITNTLEQISTDRFEQIVPVKKDISVQFDSTPSNFRETFKQTFSKAPVELPQAVFVPGKPEKVSTPRQFAAPEKTIASPANTLQDSSIQQQIPAFVEQKEFAEYHIIGQYHTTYIIIESENGLVLVDQHAAHERILYERFTNNAQTLESISLLFPTFISLTQTDLALVNPHLELLEINGIMAEQFSENQLVINAVPAPLKNVDFSDLIQHCIGWIHEYGHLEQSTLKKIMQEKLHAQIACKAAVKAGDVLSIEQMQELINSLQKTANRYSCPHGRPTSWLISLNDIERKFRRKL